ncbi:complement factor H-related protein 5 isoform X1 [Ochotona curzoniae]|uniref:complement factor H-related protein 5 isoform X1 n=1 Tax=Ochotona curzoniae TaxID=130825 RepID=UPI001B34CBD7|nr:complement factor H-related protein 5 isoform X1 [Ochotona curzoniae]
MFVLANVILLLGVPAVVGQVGLCNFPEIKHGILYDQKKYQAFLPVPIGKVFYYSCEYSFVSPSKSFWTQITCTEKGWSPTPRCLRMCFFPFVENGHSESSGKIHLQGDTVRIVCDGGYGLQNGGNSIVCTEGGWSAAPECRFIKIECPLPFLEAYLDARPKQEKYKVGDVLKFSCRQKFARVGPDSVQCYQFGWSPDFPTCKEQVQPCGPPPQLPNGKVKDSRKEEYGHGEVVQYECNSHFTVKGPSKIQCMDGEWTTLPTCVGPVQTCSSLPKLEHGYAQPSAPPYPHGATVELSCKSTHTMIGNHSISCLSGMWTELPECVATDRLKKCSRSSLGSGIFFRPHMSEYNHNTTISYRCTGSHSYMRTVCVNGNWNPKPSCTEKNKRLCPPPPQIPHAQNMTTTVNYQDGEKVAILCKENFQLQEVKELVCKNGQWQSLPQCIDSTQSCGPPPPIDNGDITSFPLLKYPPGSRVGYSCQAFYELKGPGYVTCRNGQWSEPPKCLDACIISEENMKKNNIQLKWRDSRKLYAKTGDIVEFMCKDSRKAAQHTPAFRAVCHEGKFEYPKCE